MEVLDASSIFWLAALGMLVGGVIKLVVWNKGVELVPNLIAGIIGSVIVGGISVALGLPGSLFFAFLGSLAILFILNVFHMKAETTH